MTPTSAIALRRRVSSGPLEGVRQFRILQRTLTDLAVLLVTDACSGDGEIEAIKAKYRKFMGDDLNVMVEKVPEIPLTASGKHRWIVSEVDC